jgi:hypothetical protein
MCWWTGVLHGDATTTTTPPVSVWLAYEATVAVQDRLPSSLRVVDLALTRRRDEKKKKYLFFHYSATRLDILTVARKGGSGGTLVLLESLPAQGFRFRFRSSRDGLPVPLSEEMVEAHEGKESVVVPLDARPLDEVPWASIRGKKPVLTYYHPSHKTKQQKTKFDEFAHSNPYILYE